MPMQSPRSSMARPRTAPNPARPNLNASDEDGRRPSAPAIVQTQPEGNVKNVLEHILPPEELARLMQPSPSPRELDSIPPRRPGNTNSVTSRRGSNAGSLRSTLSADKSYFFASPLPSPAEREFSPWAMPYDNPHESGLPSLPPPRRRARNPPAGVNLYPLNTSSRPSSSSSGSRLSVPTSSSAVSPISSTPTSASAVRPNVSPRLSNTRNFFPQRRPPDYAIPPLPDPGIKAAIVAAAAKEGEKPKSDEVQTLHASEKKKKVV
ncbi:hypothetical protein DACRYDRAFT_23578, partial [Dacryopinax primogenitus]